MSEAMSSTLYNTSWIWHPDWNDSVSTKSAGGFVDFRQHFHLETVPRCPVKIDVSADTRYKLYINSRFVHTGPAKGDSQEWYYDELDIQPFLQAGHNSVAVRVLRFHHGSNHAISFVRMPVPGLYIALRTTEEEQIAPIETNEKWETSIDYAARLPCDLEDDDFLHVYEHLDRSTPTVRHWVQAERYNYVTSYGIRPPWKLTPRRIPCQRQEITSAAALHNIQSSIPPVEWERYLLKNDSEHVALTLPPGTKHHLELSMAHHTTAFLDFNFTRPKSSGSSLRAQYSECYEEEPVLIPYARRKDDRMDTSKSLYGPYDIYVFGGPHNEHLKHSSRESEIEKFSTFHFRTFRILQIDIEVVPDSELVFQGLKITKTNYPLDVQARFEAKDKNQPTNWTQDLWTTSLRTLLNCMHDTYEDCPFYEQLQYAMDTRSTILFTYCVSGDDRLAKQAISQLYHSFQPGVGLTASRAPAHQLQIIPHFSLFWVCTIFDHYQYIGDEEFTRQYLAGANSILDTFHRRINPSLGLVASDKSGEFWEFVDWIPAWKPFGVPPAAQRSGYLTYTNALYAYTLKVAAKSLSSLGFVDIASQYLVRAEKVVHAIQKYCFDGEFFTDGLALDADLSQDYSPHSQIWAILCGAATGAASTNMLELSLVGKNNGKGPFEQPSVAMLFYESRALSLLGDAYNRLFMNFWDPWRKQLSQNLTTWVEDEVSQRSDCHAWGSSPLFEFIAEVVGVTPGSPGFDTILFRPRTSLFTTIKSRVPITSRLGFGVFDVEWSRESEQKDQTTIRFRIESTAELSGIETKVILEDGRCFTYNGTGPHTVSI